MPLLLIANLTKTGVSRIEPRRRQYRIWDKEVAGLYLRVFPSGRKVYELRSEHEPMTLGQHPLLSPTAARQRAKALTVSQFPGRRREQLSAQLNIDSSLDGINAPIR